MRDDLKELLTIRTVVVRYPNGDKQYWLTKENFAEGDELKRNGYRFVVESVLGPESSGGYTSVILREPAAS